MKPIVTDTYDFPTLIGEGYAYVDKTALLRRMISGVDGRFFFMSRPRRFYGFWDATGSATIIVERLRKLGKLPDEVEGLRVFPKKLDVCDAKTLPVAALMYQGGYLTIKDVDPSGELVLGIPNREVRLAIVRVGVGYDAKTGVVRTEVSKAGKS